MKMPQRKVLNVTQQQIDDAHSKAEEHYSRSSSMTRNEYNSMVAKDIMESDGGKYDTIEKVENVVEYCEDSGDEIRAKAIKLVLQKLGKIIRESFTQTEAYVFTCPTEGCEEVASATIDTILEIGNPQCGSCDCDMDRSATGRQKG